MRVKMSRVRLRDVALFVAAVGISTVIAACGFQDTELAGERAGAIADAEPAELQTQVQEEDSGESEAAEAEPLTLTLSGPETCEVTFPQRNAESRPVIDEQGNRTHWIDIQGWYWDSVGTMEIAWRASGGDGSYEVTIGGESGTGASGVVEVSCAISHGPIIEDEKWGRLHDEKPVVDSGWKTTTGTVTDGTGAEAKATLEVYMVLNRGFGGSTRDEAILEGGKTYRLYGTLMTVPEGVDLDVGTSEEGARVYWIVHIVGTSAFMYIEHGRFFEDAGRVIPDEGATGAADSAVDPDQAFDDFLDSAGRMPQPKEE